MQEFLGREITPQFVYGVELTQSLAWTGPGEARELAKKIYSG